MNSKHSGHETNLGPQSRQNILTFTLSISYSQSFNALLAIFATEAHDRVDCPYQDDAQPGLDNSKYWDIIRALLFCRSCRTSRCFCSTATDTAHRSGQFSFPSFQRLLLPPRYHRTFYLQRPPALAKSAGRAELFTFLICDLLWAIRRENFLRRCGYIVIQYRNGIVLLFGSARFTRKWSDRHVPGKSEG